MARILTWYLVRHGETAWNAERRYQGQKDQPLSDVGREQVGRLCPRFADMELAAVVTSDLSRARESAEIILRGRNLPIRIDPRLRELDYGELEGMTGAEMRRRMGSGDGSWHHGDPRMRAPGGESFADLYGRAGEALAALRAEVERGNVLIVVHGGTLRALVLHLLGLPVSEFRKFRFDSASLTVIRESGGQPALWSGTPAAP